VITSLRKRLLGLTNEDGRVFGSEPRRWWTSHTIIENLTSGGERWRVHPIENGENSMTEGERTDELLAMARSVR